MEAFLDKIFVVHNFSSDKTFVAFENFNILKSIQIYFPLGFYIVFGGFKITFLYYFSFLFSMKIV